MKKIFTLCAALFVAVMAFAQAQPIEGVIYLAKSTLDEAASTNDSWAFTGDAAAWIFAPDGGRDISKCGVSAKVDVETGVAGEWADGLNFKNKTKSTIIIPDGVSVYRMELLGLSQGDNWCYLYAYGEGSNDGWMWVEPKGDGITDNTIINTECKYPVDPCAKTDANNKYSFNQAGYTFAAIDFIDNPVTGILPLKFAGNNQMQAAIKLYITKEAAQGAATGIESVQTQQLQNGAIYNLAGQKVGNDYKGIVIKNGKKYLMK